MSGRTVAGQCALVWVAAVAAGATWSSLGCGSAHWPPDPAAVHAGEDACARCRMLLGDERHGAQLHERAGTIRLYDDLGCLLADAADEAVDPAGTFVRAWEGGAWLRGDVAVIARSPGIVSPMGYGLAAFPAAAAATAASTASNWRDVKVASMVEMLRDAKSIAVEPGVVPASSP